MPTIPIDYGQVNYKFSGVGMPFGAECTFGFQFDGVASVAAAAALFNGLWGTHLRDRTPTSINLDSVLVKQGPNDTGLFHEDGVGAAGNGATGDVIPNVAVIVQKLTSFGGRAGRGRIYWPVAEADVLNGGVVSNSYVNGSNAAFGAFMAAAEAGGAPLALLHSGGGFPHPITALSTQLRCGTQRRRLRR